MRRILHSYDRPNITADDVSHDVRSWMPMEARTQPASKLLSVPSAPMTIASVRQVILLLGQHLANARAREEKALRLMWRPMF